MPQSLNLIPDQEVQEQTQKKVVKFSSLFSIVVLIITSGVSAYFIYTTTNVNKQISDEDTKIAALRSRIQSKADVEVTARNLGKKYNSLTQILNTRPYFSLLLEEFKLRKPNEIVIRNMSLLKDNQISISGTAQTYVTITTFGNNLLQKNYPGGNAKLDGFFTNVLLNQVDLSTFGTVDFSMLIDYDPSKLTYGK